MSSTDNDRTALEGRVARFIAGDLPPATGELAGKATDEEPKPAGFHLIPRRALTALAGQYAHGAKKYGRYNWEKGRPYSDYVDALERHLGSWLEGEELDEEDKPNLIAVAWLALALYEFQHHHPELDDRRPRRPRPDVRSQVLRERGRKEVEEELRLSTGSSLTGPQAFRDWSRGT